MWSKICKMKAQEIYIDNCIHEFALFGEPDWTGLFQLKWTIVLLSPPNTAKGFEREHFEGRLPFHVCKLLSLYIFKSVRFPQFRELHMYICLCWPACVLQCLACTPSAASFIHVISLFIYWWMIHMANPFNFNHRWDFYQFRVL